MIPSMHKKGKFLSEFILKFLFNLRDKVPVSSVYKTPKNVLNVK